MARKTTDNEYLRSHKLIPMWHSPNMVSRRMSTSAHEFLDYEKYPWPEPRNGI
jgi:hypothetical protein